MCDHIPFLGCGLEREVGNTNTVKPFCLSFPKETSLFAGRSE